MCGWIYSKFFFNSEVLSNLKRSILGDCRIPEENFIHWGKDWTSCSDGQRLRKALTIVPSETNLTAAQPAGKGTELWFRRGGTTRENLTG